MQKIQTLFCSRHDFLFDPCKRLNCATQWFEVLKLWNTCEVFCLYSLRIGSPLLFPILFPSHYLEQIFLMSFLMSTHIFPLQNTRFLVYACSKTIHLYCSYFTFVDYMIEQNPNANVFYLMCEFHIAKHWIFFSEMQVV